MAARDSDAKLQAHQLGEQFAAGNDGNLEAARFRDFGIAGFERGGDHNGLCTLHIGRSVP